MCNAVWKMLIGVAVFLLAVSFANAASRTGTVFFSGNVVYSNSGTSMQSNGFNCADEDVAFTFRETVSSEEIELRRRDAGTGSGQSSIELSVEIVDVCVDNGQASFEYRHQQPSGQAIASLEVAPEQFTVQLSLDSPNAGSNLITYSVLDSGSTGGETASLNLVGGAISFFGDGVFGQINRSDVLATIRVSGGPPVDVDDPGLVSEDERIRDAVESFNRACEADSAGGTEFGDICNIVGAEADTSQKVAQVAEAFDPHELSAASGAAVEGGRIQMANIGSRIAALRGGASGLSLGGIALAYNGNTFDSSWLPVSLSSSAANSAGSTLLDERLGVFVNGEISLGDRDRRGKEVGFDFDSWGLTAGVDYRFDNGLIAGAAAGYSKYDADLDFDGGNLDSETLSLQLFGTYDVTDRLYLDMTFGVSDLDFDQQRVVDLSGIGSLTRSVASGGAGGSQQSASLAVNYRFPWDSRWSAVSYGQAFIARTKIDAFEEQGSPFALAYPEQKFYSRTYTGGVRISRAVNFSNGVLTPFADASYSYEDGNDGYSIQPALIETGALGPLVEISDPDRSFGQLDAGVSWVFISGQQLFLRYSGLIGERDTTRHSIHFGARFEF